MRVVILIHPHVYEYGLYCVRLDSNILEYISQTKYLGFMFNTNAQDDEDMLRQMRTIKQVITHFPLLFYRC